MNIHHGLSREQLVEYFASGCKPKHAWRIGTEHEKIGFCMDTFKPIPYEGKRSIRRLLELLATEGWRLIREGNLPIALRRNGANITLEPGGQLELSGAPLNSAHETCQETGEHLKFLRRAMAQLGIGFLSLGSQPKWPQEDIPWMPKDRYQIMRSYMPKVGKSGLNMMLRTATVQVNLDFSSEQDMARKMRVGVCLQPLVTALYAASPFVDGKPSGYLSYRALCWQDTDLDRTGIPSVIFKDDFGFEHYADWALDAPMYFVIRGDRYIDCSGQSFRDFLKGKLPALPGELPTLTDWELHLTTVYPDVRLKQYIEMRGADAGPRAWICSLPALWKGLLYDKDALDKTWEMIADWTHKEVICLRRAVAKSALQTPFRDTTALSLCKKMLNIAEDGLAHQNIQNSRGQNETIFLKPLKETVTSEKTQSEIWLEAYTGRWHEDIDAIFAEATHP
ncbi:MAG: glutamate--cysteine ligase [Mariprofundaceae bacterium]